MFQSIVQMRFDVDCLKGDRRVPCFWSAAGIGPLSGHPWRSQDSVPLQRPHYRVEKVYFCPHLEPVNTCHRDEVQLWSQKDVLLITGRREPRQQGASWSDELMEPRGWLTGLRKTRTRPSKVAMYGHSRPPTCLRHQ